MGAARRRGGRVERRVRPATGRPHAGASADARQHRAALVDRHDADPGGAWLSGADRAGGGDPANDRMGACEPALVEPARVRLPCRGRGSRPLRPQASSRQRRHLSVNFIFTSTRTATGLPSLVPGLKAHSFIALTAFSSRPYTESSDSFTATVPTVPSALTTTLRSTSPSIICRIASAVYCALT